MRGRRMRKPTLARPCSRRWEIEAERAWLEIATEDGAPVPAPRSDEDHRKA